MGMSSTLSVQIYGNSVRPILFVFEVSKDPHASLNAGWFVQGQESPECQCHLNKPADAVNTVPSQHGDFVAYSMLYREPVEDIMQDWGDVAELPRNNNESLSSVQNHLKSLNFSFRHTL